MSIPVVRACLTTTSNHWTNAAGPSSTDWLGGIRTASSVTSRPRAAASFDFIASRKARWVLSIISLLMVFLLLSYAAAIEIKDPGMADLRANPSTLEIRRIHKLFSQRYRFQPRTSLAVVTT